jgi:hypothetical protein
MRDINNFCFPNNCVSCAVYAFGKSVNDLEKILKAAKIAFEAVVFYNRSERNVLIIWYLNTSILSICSTI